MRYLLLAPLLIFLLFSLSMHEAFATYPSCNQYDVNTTLHNTTLTGYCYWGGGDLYLTWSPGDNYIFKYNVSTYQNQNATFVVSGGATYQQRGACKNVSVDEYYPKSNYRIVIQVTDLGDNYTCPTAYAKLENSLQSTTTTYLSTIYSTTIPPTSLPSTTSVTTTINVTTVIPTPSLQLSSYQIYAGSTINATVRGLSTSDAVELIMNGNIVASGLGVASYNSRLPAGNYSFRAYDVNKRSYSKTLILQVLIPTSTSTSVPTSLYTTSQSSASSSTTTVQGYNSSTNGGGSSGNNFGITIIEIIAIAATAYLAIRYIMGRRGNGGTTVHVPERVMPPPPSHIDRPNF